jgi:hypothetical protein
MEPATGIQPAVFSRWCVVWVNLWSRLWCGRLRHGQLHLHHLELSFPNAGAEWSQTIPMYHRSVDGLTPRRLHGWIGSHIAISTSPELIMTSRLKELDDFVREVKNVSVCCPIGRSAHFGNFAWGLTLPSQWPAASRMDTIGCWEEKLRAGVRIMPCNSSPVRYSFLALRSFRRASHGSFLSERECTEYAASRSIFPHFLTTTR